MSNELDDNVSIFGVIAKIADFYGMFTAGELLKRLEIKKPRTVALYDWRVLKNVTSNNQIQQDIHKHLPCLPIDRMITQRRQYAHSISSNRTRVCRECIGEGTLHQDTWQQPFYTHCEKHLSRLSDGCEHIYADGTWPEWALCKHCDLQHKQEIVGSDDNQLPSYFRYWVDLYCPIKRKNFIGQLYMLAERMIRPFDFIQPKIAWQTLSIKQTSVILEDAFRLGSSTNTKTLWGSKIKKMREALVVLGRVTQEHGIGELTSLLDSLHWPKLAESSHDILEILERYHNAVTPNLYSTRFHLSEDDNGDEVALRAPNLLVKQLLDVDERALPELVQKGTLPVKKNALRTDKLIFDLRDVSDAVTKMFCFPVHHFERAVSIHGIEQRVLDTLLLDTKIATMHLLAGRLKGYWSVDSTLSLINRATLSAESVNQLFQFELVQSDHLSANKVARLLGIRKPGVELLVKTGILKSAKWQRYTNENIDIESLQNMLNDYICLNREAILKGFPVNELLDQVSTCCGIKPCFNDINFKDHVPVVLYKKADLNTCCLDTAMNKLEALKPVGIDLSKKVKRFSNAA